MAWTAPKTWSALEVVTAAMLNQYLRDNQLALSSVGTYTPTLVQSGAVTKTITFANYTNYGSICDAWIRMVCTGAGTTNNPVTIGLPLTATSSFMLIGSARVYDQNTTETYYGAAITATDSSTFTIVRDGGTDNVGKIPNFALASGDVIDACVRFTH